MKVCGFTFIRNAIKYDYPIIEAIRSILPICDEVVVAVGQSEDATLELIQSISSNKIRIVETVWDDSLREGGKVLAEETNKALRAIPQSFDWAVYIQGDEALHEKDHKVIRSAMQRYLHDQRWKGLLFNYAHFYGSYDFVGTSSNWYHNEIRVVKNNARIYSYGDAQGFRIGANNKLRVKAVDATVYHYGWVRPPEFMQKKVADFHSLYHDDDWMEQQKEVLSDFEYEDHVKSVAKFEGSHPQVMQARIAKTNWKFEYDISFRK